MNGILYFSSTGNSLYLAQKIREENPGKILYIPTYQGDGAEFEKIIVVSPIYSYGLPVHVYDLIGRLAKNVPVYVVLNYGGMAAGADWFTLCHCRENGLDIRAVHTMKMPENFTLSFTVPKFYMNSTLRAAPKKIEKIAKSIAAGETVLPGEKKTKAETYLKNKPNWYKIGQDFRVSENCNACGKCVSVCPVGNISLMEGKIRFSDKCVACLGCYHRCPNKAIRYQNKKKKFRYVNPNVREGDIGKDM